jgi:hypothetical protein
MNSERLNLIVNELRRGEFIQGEGCLRQPGSHCALGVACEVFRRQTGQGRWVQVGHRFSFVASGEGRGYGLWSETAMPAPEVTRWYLHDPQDPRLEDELNMLFQEVAMRNDRGVPFGELARMIEAFVAEEEGGTLAAVC